MIVNRKLLGIAALIGSIFVFGGGKATEFINEIRSSINQIKYRIAAIRNLEWLGGITDPRLRFKFDLELINPSSTDFNFNAGSTITIKKIIFKDKQGLPLVTSYPNISSVNLPAKGKQLIKNIPAEIPVKKLGIAFDTISNLQPGQLKLDVYVEIAGKEIMLNRSYFE